MIYTSKLTEPTLTYSQQLLTEQWHNKRMKILCRDGFKCTVCSSTKLLQVHHTKYLFGKLAWQYPDSWLVTLCSKCHKKVHKIKTKARKRRRVVKKVIKK